MKNITKQNVIEDVAKIDVNICVTTKNITFTGVISYLCVYMQFQNENSCCFVKNWNIKISVNMKERAAVPE